MCANLKSLPLIVLALQNWVLSERLIPECGNLVVVGAAIFSMGADILFLCVTGQKKICSVLISRDAWEKLMYSWRQFTPYIYYWAYAYLNYIFRYNVHGAKHYLQEQKICHTWGLSEANEK